VPPEAGMSARMSAAGASRICFRGDGVRARARGLPLPTIRERPPTFLLAGGLCQSEVEYLDRRPLSPLRDSIRLRA